MDADLRVEISAEDPYEDVIARTSAAVLAHPLILQDLAGADLWMASFDVLDKNVTPSSRFLATIRDLTSGRTVTARGRLDDAENITVDHTAHQRPPTDDEFAWAIEVLTTNEGRAAPVKAEDEELYRPVPPLGNVQQPDGSVDRVISVGLRSPDGRHRAVGVRTSDGTVVTELPGSTAGSAEAAQDCGAALGETCAPSAGARHARVRVWQQDELLWDLVVVRPSASSGTNGSGVELRTVDYRGQRVLHRAHVPILNVAYDAGSPPRCGPTYRDWQHDEACFLATAGDEDSVEGFRLCSEPPATILDSGVEGGNFRGVALWLDGPNLVIVSQLQAGWYRYVSEWQLAADGTIRPRFGFAAATNPCTCQSHVHHAYWRFDFDVLDPAGNVVQEFNDPPLFGTSNWHTMRYECRRPRDAAHHRYWRIRHDRFSAGYQLVPGPADGDADDYGVGDVWVLRYRDGELDDGQGFTTDPAWSRAQLDRFVTGEPAHRQDLVIWYAAHFSHDPAASSAGSGIDADHRVGPDLVPWRWVPVPPAGAPVEPPVPPPVPGT